MKAKWEERDETGVMAPLRGRAVERQPGAAGMGAGPQLSPIAWHRAVLGNDGQGSRREGCHGAVVASRLWRCSSWEL